LHILIKILIKKYYFIWYINLIMESIICIILEVIIFAYYLFIYHINIYLFLK